MRPKRLISLLVAVCMMITMLPLSAVTAFAADTAAPTGTAIVNGCEYDYKINTADGTATITKFRAPDDHGSYDITIPTAFGRFPVTDIGDYAFSGCHSLTTLSLGENIKTIGSYAFYDCTQITGSVTIPQSVTSIGNEAFRWCSGIDSLTINNAATSIGEWAFASCFGIKTLSLGEKIKTIGYNAFSDCSGLTNVTIPQSVTSIGPCAFAYCTSLKNITIPEKVKTIEPYTFGWCTSLKYITLPAGLTSFKDRLVSCPAGFTKQSPKNGAIYYNNDKTAAERLRDNPDDQSESYHILANRNFLYLCKVTFDANGGDQTDYPEMSVYKTKKINANDLAAIKAPTRAGYNFTGWYTDTDGKQLFNADETAITDDITLHAGWKFDPDAPGCHPLTVTGGTVTVKYDGSDVTSKLNSNTDETTGQKTYDVPDGAEVTVTLDKTLIPKGKVFDGWSTTGNLSLLTGQDSKAETITFTMSSDVKVSAKYRDAATDHTPDTAVCRPLTVTGGIVTVKKGDKDVTDTLTVTTDETTGKKTYSVPDGATVTVTLDKTLIPEGMVFDIWSTGKFSLPLGQDYKAESITFTMNTMSSDANIAAQYRDASIEDDGPNVLGTAAIIGTAAVGTAVLGYQAYSLGAEFAGKLMALPYFPSNRSALAMMLWEDAGKPMPESELLYPDVGQEEQDMDLQHAARWAMENELIPDLNDEGTAPEEMKFFPANPVSKLDVLNAWQKAQELKNN